MLFLLVLHGCSFYFLFFSLTVVIVCVCCNWELNPWFGGSNLLFFLHRDIYDYVENSFCIPRQHVAEMFSDGFWISVVFLLFLISFKQFPFHVYVL